VKFIIIRYPFANRGIAQALVQTLGEQDAVARKDTVVLLQDSQTGKELKAVSKELFELASRKGNTVQEFEYLTGPALQAWVRKETERQNCTFDGRAISSLIQRVGQDTGNLSQEVTKLANYKGSLGVSEDDVITMTSAPSDLNIFDLVDAFAIRDRPRAYSLLYRELQSGRDPYYILTMMTYQVRNLLLVSDLTGRKLSQGEIVKQSGLHPFVVRKSLEQCRKFTETALRKLYTTLALMEYHTKQGTMNLSDQLYLL